MQTILVYGQRTCSIPWPDRTQFSYTLLVRFGGSESFAVIKEYTYQLGTYRWQSFISKANEGDYSVTGLWDGSGSACLTKYMHEESVSRHIVTHFEDDLYT